MIATPCIGVCSTAVGDEVCFGCARTFAEVSDWLALSAERRAQISCVLARRKVWLQLAAQTGGRLTAIDDTRLEAALALTPDFVVTVGWPQLLDGLAHVPLLMADGRNFMLPVYRDDWLQRFWSHVFALAGEA